MSGEVSAVNDSLTDESSKVCLQCQHECLSFFDSAAVTILTTVHLQIFKAQASLLQARSLMLFTGEQGALQRRLVDEGQDL